MPELNKQAVETWLETIEPNKRFHYKGTINGKVDPDSFDALRKIYSRLKTEGKIASCGINEGWYYRVEPISPIVNLEGGGQDYIDLVFPRSHLDDDVSEFGFEDLFAISPGDMVVIAGVSNSAKSSLILNLLADNIKYDKGIRLMGNEYVTADKTINPRFRRRLQCMNWSPVFTDGKLDFELLPVKTSFANYIKKNAINLIDWIAMPTNFFEIQGIHDSIKEKIGEGVVFVVMQKTKGKDYGDGGEFSERLADFYMTLDFLNEFESRVTLGKVKEAKAGARHVSGRSWAFEPVKGGASQGTHLRNIREITKCTNCWGKGWKQMGQSSKPCEVCNKIGWIDLPHKEIYAKPKADEIPY